MVDLDLSKPELSTATTKRRFKQNRAEESPAPAGTVTERRRLYPFQEWVADRQTPALLYLLLAIKHELVGRGLARDLRVRTEAPERLEGVPSWLLVELLEGGSDAVERNIQGA